MHEPDAEDPLTRLEEGIRAAREAAERLARAAGEGEGRANAPPPRGWKVPHAEDSERGAELGALLELARTLRDSLPTELSEQLAELVRTLLVALRALIDWYLERVEPGDREAPTVEEISID